MNSASFLDPETWAIGLQNGNEKALQHFFSKYSRVLAWFATNYLDDEFLVSEIVEDSFVLLWQHREGFSNYQAIVAYLYNCTRNAALYQRRKLASANRVKKELLYIGSDIQQSVQEDIIRAETLRQIHESIEQLPEQCRRVFKMHFIEGKDYATIAGELHLSVSTIRNQKARAVMLIRKNMKLSFVPGLIFFQHFFERV